MKITVILKVDGVDYVCRCFENESIQINKIVGSVDELGKQGTFSKDFFMPLEGGLVEAIGDITDPSVESKVNLNKAVQGRILVNGFERFKGSFFFINFLVEPIKQVQVLFQGDESNVKSILSNVKMSELFVGETILYNYTEMVDYFLNPEGYIASNGYAFPLIDFGDQYDGSTIGTLYENNFKPAVTFKKCFDLMPIEITTTGIDSLLGQTILLHNNNSKYPTLTTSALSNTGYMESDVDSSIASNNVPINIFYQIGYTYSNPSLIDLASNQFNIPATGIYSGVLNGDIDVENTGGSNSRFEVILRVGSSIVAIANTLNLAPGGVAQFTFTNLNFSVFATSGSVLASTVEVVPQIGTNHLTTRKAGFKFEILSSPAFAPESEILIEANCPDITAWDIFRFICLQCNGMITINENGSVNINPWKNWIDEGTQSFIIDELIESGTTPLIKPFSLNGAKTIRLDYKEADDHYNKIYLEVENERFGSHVIEDTGTELAKNTIEISMPLSVTPSIPIANSSASIPKIYDESFNPVKGSYILNRTFDKNIYIPFVFGSLFSSSSLNVYQIPFFGNWETLLGGYNTNDNNFGQSLSFFSSTNYPKNTLYERFWKKYLEETYTEKSRELSIRLKLSIDEIDRIQFNDKFYYKNKLWRLLKLENIELAKDGYVSATLMKRFTIFNNERAPLYPYNVINSIVQWKDSNDNTDLGDANGEPSADVKESADYYGFFYDSVRNIATQNGQILIT